MNDFITSVSNWLWDYYLLATALLAAVLLASRMLTQPARRLAIHWAIAVGLLLLALLCAIPGWSLLHMTSPPPPEAVQWMEYLEPVTGPAIQIADLPQSFTPAVPRVEELPADVELSQVVPAERIVLINYGILVSYAIGIGALVSLLWLALGAWQVHRLRSQAEPAPEPINQLLEELAQPSHRKPAIGMSDRLTVAVAVGLRRPMVLLPSSLAEQSGPHELRTVLAHELAHIRNHDLWLLALVRSLLPLLWVHPLYWLWRRGLRLDQETLADAAASEQTSQADYADQLVTWARSAAGMQTPRFASSVGLWESPSQLKRRVTVLLDKKLTVLRECSRKWRWGSIIGGTMAVLAAGLSLITLQPDTQLLAEPQAIDQDPKPAAESSKQIGEQDAQTPGNATLGLQFDPAKATGIGTSLTEMSEDDLLYALVPATPITESTVADSEELVFERANFLGLEDDFQPQAESNRGTVQLADRPSSSIKKKELNSLDLRLGPTVPSDPSDAETSAATLADSPREPDFNKLVYPLYKHLEKSRKPNTIVGICIDEFGQPLADVDVRLYAQPVGLPLQRATTMVARTKSNAQGKFILTSVIDVAKLFPEGIPTSFVPQKQQHIYTLIGKLSGRVPGRHSELAASMAKSGTTTVWVMQEAQTLRGSITDLNGNPVRGATVKVGLASMLLGSNDLNLSSTVTDVQGNYSISDLPPYDATDADRQIEEMLKKNPELASTMAGGALRQQLLVTHPEFAAQRVTVDRIPSTVNARLRPGSTIEGKVTFPTPDQPKAIPAGIVYLQRDTPTSKAGERPQPYSFQVQSTSIDADGRYRFESLPAGKYHLSAGVPSWVTLGIENVVTKTGEVTTAPDIAMTRGGRVRVQLLDGDGQPLRFDKPMTGWINPQRVPREKVFSHTTNVRTFSVEGIGETQLAPGTYRLNVNVPTGDGQVAWIASDFADLRSTEDLEKISTTKVVEGQTVELQIRTKKWNPQSGAVLSSLRAITEDGDVVEVEEHEGEDSPIIFAPVQQTVPSVSGE